jgi:hypothetical protein
MNTDFHAPASPAAGLAVRPLLEMVMGIGISTTLGQIHTIQDRIRGWLDANPPGQPIAIEPRGCPLTGACSCVEVPPTAPMPWPALLAIGAKSGYQRGHEDTVESCYGDPEEVAAELTEQLMKEAEWAGVAPKAPDPAPVPVAERLPEARDFDEQGTCWCFHGTAFTWGLFQFDLTAHTHWLPHWALPTPPKTQP